MIIIHTEWDEFKTIDFKNFNIKKNTKIYDMRNLYSPQRMKKLGYLYYSIGRQYDYISKIASISTAIPNGKEFVLTAALACFPLIPKISLKSSEAAFNTLG